MALLCPADGDALEARFCFFGLRDNAGNGGQLVVHQAALVGIQLLHEQRLAGLEHPLGAGAGAAQQLGFCAGSVVIAVEADARGIAPLCLHQTVHHVLQVIQTVSLIADEKAGIRAFEQQGDAILIGFGSQRVGESQRCKQGCKSLGAQLCKTFHVLTELGELISAAEKAQQGDEQVNEVQVQLQRAKNSRFALDGIIIAETDFQQVLRIIGREKREQDNTHAGDSEIEPAALQPEDIDHNGCQKADERHEQGSAPGPQVTLGDKAVDGHGAEHDGGAAKGLAYGVQPVIDEHGPEQKPLNTGKGE